MIDASNPALQWQQTYTSPEYSSGTHVVTLKHVGGGTYIDIDAIRIYGPAPAGLYDDTHGNWTYTGTWTTYSGTGPYNKTMHYTGTIGNTASFKFYGTQFTLLFTKHTNRGSFEVWLDGTTMVTTIDASNSTLAWQQTYTSPVYSNGEHTVTLEYTTGGMWTSMRSGSTVRCRRAHMTMGTLP